jgi:hypothetical protein
LSRSRTSFVQILTLAILYRRKRTADDSLIQNLVEMIAVYFPAFLKMVPNRRASRFRKVIVEEGKRIVEARSKAIEESGNEVDVKGGKDMLSLCSKSRINIPQDFCFIRLTSDFSFSSQS